MDGFLVLLGVLGGLALGMVLLLALGVEIAWAIWGDHAPAGGPTLEDELTRLLAKDMPIGEARTEARRRLKTAR